MSATHSNKKRKLEGDQQKTKASRRPFKKSKRYTYHSDSEDEDAEVTARDAPKPDVKVAAVDRIDPESVNRIPLSKRPQKAQKSKDVRPKVQQVQQALNEGKPVNKAQATSKRDTDEKDFDNEQESESEADDYSDDDDDDEASSSSADSQTETSSTRPRTKRHDPAAFATSISAILGSSLSRNKRVDPVLSRSKDAAEVSKALAESKLDVKARKQLVAERRLAKEKGRVRDVLIGDRKATITIGEDGEAAVQVGDGPSAAEILAKEKQLRKLAQRGVVKLFNAVRAAQVRGEEEARKVKADGVVGMDNREDKVKSMSKNAFLDLVGAGGERR